MVGALTRNPGITAFAVGTVALGTANALAPDHELVGAANTAGTLGGLATGIFAAGTPAGAVGWGILGASLIGRVIGRDASV